MAETAIEISKFGDNARAVVSVKILQLCIGLIDALGFEARVYADGDGKRLADVYKHEEFNLAQAFTIGHQFRTLIMNLLKSLGDEQAERDEDFNFKNTKEK